MICANRQIPNSAPKFHQSLIVDSVGKSTRALFAVLNKGCLFRVGLFIILCFVVAPWIHYIYILYVIYIYIHTHTHIYIYIYISNDIELRLGCYRQG
jgi:type IV secretory pathway VirB6-like protein